LEPALVIALVVVLLVVVVMLGLRRRPRQDEGMQTFRRHIDALSPEARREVMDRARRHDARDGAQRGSVTDPGIASGGRGTGRDHDATDGSGSDSGDGGGGDGGGD
jgi:hypothetical protein